MSKHGDNPVLCALTLTIRLMSSTLWLISIIFAITVIDYEDPGLVKRADALFWNIYDATALA